MTEPGGRTRVAPPSPAEARSAVFLNRFYWPDIAATGQMLTDLAEDLAGEGWNVTVIASRFLYEQEGRILPPREHRNGVQIIRVGGTRFGRHRLAARVADYLTYYLLAAIHTVRLGRREFYVAMSDPPLIAMVAVLAARIRGGLAVYWVQDLFPQLAITLGVMSPRGLASSVVRRIARWVNAASDLVIVLGPTMASEMVRAGARPSRTRVVHNWADVESIHPIPASDNPFIESADLREKFVVLYSGNAGRAHVFDAVVSAAETLREQSDIVFLLIGGGQRRPALEESVRQRRLANVRFMPYQPRDLLAQSLSAASISLVTENPDVVGMLVPSKTYGILASGRPILFVGSASSDVAAIVRDTDCGVVVSPDDPASLVSAILLLRDNTEMRERLGRNARAAAEKLYARRVGTGAWKTVVETLARDRGLR